MPGPSIGEQRDEVGALAAGSVTRGDVLGVSVGPSGRLVCTVGGDGVRVVGAGCVFRATEDDKYFVNGTRLHKAAGPFQDGTTLSHADDPRAVVSPYVYACDPAGALQLTEDDNTLLRAVGVQCLPSGMRLVTTPTPTSPPRSATEGDPSTAQTSPRGARANSATPTGTSSLIPTATWVLWWGLAWWAAR